MAAILLVLGAAMVKERIDKKKWEKQRYYDSRYDELQAEHRIQSGADEDAVIEHDGEEDVEEGEDGPPPDYEHVVRTGSGRPPPLVPERNPARPNPSRPRNTWDDWTAPLPERKERRKSGFRKLMKLG